MPVVAALALALAVVVALVVAVAVVAAAVVVVLVLLVMFPMPFLLSSLAPSRAQSALFSRPGLLQVSPDLRETHGLGGDNMTAVVVLLTRSAMWHSDWAL